MLRGGWRQHVQAELRTRERRVRGLRGLLERHEKLQDRLDALVVQGKVLPAGEASRGPLELASFQIQQELEITELRQERVELRQQVDLLTDVLRETEAENKDQRARMRHLAQDLAAVNRQYEEVKCQAWTLSQEAEGLRKDLEWVQGLLQESQQERLDLEARWVKEKAMEAKRVNWANEQEEKSRRRVRRLQEKLASAREAAALILGPATETSSRDSSFSTSCDKADSKGQIS
ncbi:leucine zipper putative tumor suppressor 1-like isoform X2 [Rhineura floridana]|uniref:leucine zipper putative tumor suppressor 1-like isoform X2 n=1 Tax=Rhineura floridana TaxID=261503 RepID=UPI002AC85798|nr:leucine zipper putative tumor suppressor 1-like isoform X2 [Rhineura floridana]